MARVKSSTLRSLFLASLTAVLAACGGGGGGDSGAPPAPQNQSLPQTYTPSGKAASGGAFVHLFEWKWTDVAKECENFLGPNGFAAVQVSPPNEHALITSPPYPWWQRYQPVSYALKSRSGSDAELKDMVTRCHAAGVDIYVDAVINHMAAGSGVGSAGDTFTPRSFPAVPYAAADFHSPACGVSNYNDANNVQNCDLSGLPDLNTGSDAVRQKIADYLTSLVVTDGVAGFRIDAAKHISPIDLDAIVSRVNAAVVAAGKPRPYYFLEVIDNPGEAVQPQQYYGVGFASGGSSDITEFQLSYRISDAFLNRNGQNPSSLLTNTAGLIASDKAIVFTNNHDNQRQANIYFADGAAHDLAYVYMLAQPYGYPSIMSSYFFDRSTQAGRDAGPPSDASGNTDDIYVGTSATPSCSAGTWICEHRLPQVVGMVGFRKAVASASLVANTWTGSPNQIAFSRADSNGAKGFVVINRDAAAISNHLYQTSLPAGTYCDVITGQLAGNACTGTSVSVNSGGQAIVSVGADSAMAIHVGAKF